MHDIENKNIMTRKMIKILLISKLTLVGAGVVHEKHHHHIHNKSYQARTRWQMAQRKEL